MKVKDPFDLSPDFPVPRGSKIPRWQNNWIDHHKSINYSGLIFELLSQYIKEYDPQYYEQYKHLIKDIRRKETTPIPKLKPVLLHTSM